MKNIKSQKIPELLAPAGNLEKMKTAFAFGADAVYLGIPDFSLRVRINDFDLKKLKEGVEYAHKNNKKVYITVNIFAHNKHLEKLPPYIKESKKIGVDALIVSDPGILMLVKKVWPQAVIHLSTQANCTNWQAVEFWYKAGVSRIILGREVTLEEIREIHNVCPKVELEYFVHGAMCMSYSGRCFLSKYFNNRSANLGDCTQPCRWNYFISEENRPEQYLELVEEEHGSYILNSKDLCLIKHLLDLQEAGVMSFKIEGRAKSVYYQGMVAGIYRQALTILNSKKSNEEKKKIIDVLYGELKNKLVHRGYTDGFLLGKEADQNIDESHKKSNWEFCGQVIKSEKQKLSAKFSKKYLNYVRVHNSIKLNDTIEVVMPFYDIIKMKVESLHDSKTGQVVKEAHGGQNKEIIIESNIRFLDLSVIRRKM